MSMRGMVLGLESIPFMKLTASVTRPIEHSHSINLDALTCFRPVKYHLSGAADSGFLHAWWRPAY